MTYCHKVSEADLLAAIDRHDGNIAAAARELGVDKSGLARRVQRLKRLADVPEANFTPRAYSTLKDGAGNVKLVWEKTERNNSKIMLEATVEALAEPIAGLAKPVKAPKAGIQDSLSSYIIGDAHFGMYAWGEETGADFDTSIASRDLRAAIDHLVDTAPASEYGMLVDVGDFLHADNRSNVTPGSGHILDVDTRFRRVCSIAVDALRYCIARMLQKHSHVRVIVAQGNHNPDSAGWMAICLKLYYENEPRVDVDMSPGKFHYHEFGQTLIGITHGDRLKIGELPSIMAADRPGMWGKAKHRYWWTGHIHHTKHQEYRGCTVEAFNTLAASDAWHSASGYRSMRQMQRIDIDVNHGIYSRAICNLGMINERH
jgi:MarR family